MPGEARNSAGGATTASSQSNPDASTSAEASNATSSSAAASSMEYYRQLATVTKVIKALPPGLVQHELKKCVRSIRTVLERDDAQLSTKVHARLVEFLDKATKTGLVTCDADRLMLMIHHTLLSKEFDCATNTDEDPKDPGLPSDWRRSDGVYGITYKAKKFSAPELFVRGVIVAGHMCVTVTWTTRSGGEGGGETAVELSLRDFVNDGQVFPGAVERLMARLQKQVLNKYTSDTAAANSTSTRSVNTSLSRATAADADNIAVTDRWGRGPFRGGDNGYQGLLVGPDHPMFRAWVDEDHGPGHFGGGGGARPRFDIIGPGNPDPHPGHIGGPGNTALRPPDLEDEHQLLGSATQRRSSQPPP